MYVWPISPSCEIFPVMPPRILPTTTTSGIINTKSGIRAEGSHRPDGDWLIWWGLSLEREIVRNPSASLSPTLSKNEKVKQYIRKKTHKPTALRFWVKGGVIPLCMFDPFLLLVRYLRLCPLGFSQQSQQVVS